MPDRVACQFGRVQDIPQVPIQAPTCKLSHSLKSYAMGHGANDHVWRAWCTWQMEAFPVSMIMGPEATYVGQVSDRYMEWFGTHTHIPVGNPKNDVADLPRVDVPSGSASDVKV